MKRFVIDDLREIVSHCGMDGMNHDGGIAATVCHSALIVMVACLHLFVIGYNGTMVCLE